MAAQCEWTASCPMVAMAKAVSPYAAQLEDQPEDKRVCLEHARTAQLAGWSVNLGPMPS